MLCNKQKKLVDLDGGQHIKTQFSAAWCLLLSETYCNLYNYRDWPVPISGMYCAKSRVTRLFVARILLQLYLSKHSCWVSFKPRMLLLRGIETTVFQEEVGRALCKYYKIMYFH